MKYASSATSRLLQHARSIRYRRVVSDANAASRVVHPSCGDIVSLTAVIRDGTLELIGYQVEGCLLSQAAAAVLAEKIEGKPFREVEQFSVADLIQSLEVDLGPTRRKCVTLVWDALQDLIRSFHAQSTQGVTSDS